MKQVGAASYTFETRNSGMIGRTRRRPHGFLVYSSKSKAFLTFLLPQVVPQFRRCKASFRHCGVLRHLTFVILLIAIVSSLLWPLGRVRLRGQPRRHSEPHPSVEESAQSYTNRLELESYAGYDHMLTRTFQTMNVGIPRGQDAINSRPTVIHQALKEIQMARRQKEKERNFRKRRLLSTKSMRNAKLTMSKQQDEHLEDYLHEHYHRRSVQAVSNAKWSEHLEVENGTLRSLPFTRWNLDKETMKFTPSKHMMTNVRLISLKDACFCTKRNKFIVPRRSINKTSFPGFFYRYGASKMVSWDKPESLLTFKNQTVRRISGRTILWRGRSLNVYQQHLQASLIAIRSLIDILKKKNDEPVYIAAESLAEQGNRDFRTSKLQDYYIGDISVQRRLELKKLRPQMICFDEVYAVGSEFENHAMSYESYDRVKELVEKREKGRLKHRLARSCEEDDANKKTIWIMNKQQVNGHYGSIANVAEVKIGVEHEVIKAGLAKTVTTRVVQAPNIVCPKGSAREGCVELNCAKGSSQEDCIRSESMVRDVIGFNNMTFLITTSGPGNNGLVYMPRGSNVVEVVPYGVYEHSHEQVARDAGMEYHRVTNQGDRKIEERLYARFGDVARSPRTCWADLECRSARTSRATLVDVHALRFILKGALSNWKKTCHV